MHALHVERVERQAVAAVAAGADISVLQMLEDFDRELHAEPEVVDGEYASLREALGV